MGIKLISSYNENIINHLQFMRFEVLPFTRSEEFIDEDWKVEIFIE